MHNNYFRALGVKTALIKINKIALHVERPEIHVSKNILLAKMGPVFTHQLRGLVLKVKLTLAEKDTNLLDKYSTLDKHAYSSKFVIF